MFGNFQRRWTYESDVLSNLSVYSDMVMVFLLNILLVCNYETTSDPVSTWRDNNDIKDMISTKITSSILIIKGPV